MLPATSFAQGLEIPEVASGPTALGNAWTDQRSEEGQVVHHFRTRKTVNSWRDGTQEVTENMPKTTNAEQIQKDELLLVITTLETVCRMLLSLVPILKGILK